MCISVARADGMQISQGGARQTPLDALQLTQAVEAMVRAVHNLHEELHHARPSYLLLTPTKVRLPAGVCIFGRDCKCNHNR